jgi:hypothetical protein
MQAEAMTRLWRVCDVAITLETITSFPAEILHILLIKSTMQFDDHSPSRFGTIDDLKATSTGFAQPSGKNLCYQGSK